MAQKALEVASAIRRWEEHVPTSAISWILPDVPRLYPEIIALIRSGAFNGQGQG